MNFLKPYSLKKSILLLLILFVLVSSCATKRIEIQYYEGGLDERLKGLERIRSIKSDFSIEFDKGDGITIRGEGILNLSEEALDLQVYSMGFLVAEVKADRSGIRSEPVISKNKLLILVDGLRNSFFWWDLKGFSLEDEGESFILSNSWKRLVIYKKTMMPSRLTIDLEGGNRLDISYYEPADINGFVFPSRMRIELSNYAVNLKIKNISVINN